MFDRYAAATPPASPAHSLQDAETRDAQAMLTAERVRLAGVTPAQRARWAEYLAEFGRNGVGRL